MAEYEDPGFTFSHRHPKIKLFTEQPPMRTTWILAEIFSIMKDKEGITTRWIGGVGDGVELQPISQGQRPTEGKNITIVEVLSNM